MRPSREFGLGNTVLLRIEIVPALYLAYVLIRGSISGWYPYPFMNPGVVAWYGAVAIRSTSLFGRVHGPHLRSFTEHRISPE